MKNVFNIDKISKSLQDECNFELKKTYLEGFKVLKTKSEECWFELMIYTISEQILKNSIDFADINGISISPKKSFCIIKIWNNDSSLNKNSYLKEDIPNVNLDECLYKAHVNR